MQRRDQCAQSRGEYSSSDRTNACPGSRCALERQRLQKRTNGVRSNFNFPFLPPHKPPTSVCPLLSQCVLAHSQCDTHTKDKTQVDQTLFLRVSAHHLFLFLLHPSPPLPPITSLTTPWVSLSQSFSPASSPRRRCAS